MTAPRGVAGGRRVRVAFLIPSFGVGGAERVLIGFANGLPSDRFESHVVVLSSKGPLRSDLSRDVALHDIGRPRVRHALPALFKLLRALRPVVLVVSAPHLSTPILLARTSMLPGVKVVLREASLPSIALADARYPRVSRWSYQSLHPTAALVVATSVRQQEELVRHGTPPENTAVVPNPVDAGRIRSAAQAVERVSGPGRRFVAAGRLNPEKGFDRLLAVIAAQEPDTHCTLLGEGPLRSQLEVAASQLDISDRMSFPGFCSNPWSHMAGADALVLPSRREGLPNVALEALACGTPVVATPESGGIAEIAEQAPDGAVTVLPIEDFAEHLASIPTAPPTALRPSLLPDAYHASNAVAALANELERLTRPDS